MKSMPLEIQKKIDAVLERVKEPETGRSIGELNLVRRLRYSESEKILQVFMNIGEPRSTCMVCTIVNGKLAQSIEREVLQEMEKDFPELSIEIVP